MRAPPPDINLCVCRLSILSTLLKGNETQRISPLFALLWADITSSISTSGGHPVVTGDISGHLSREGNTVHITGSNEKSGHILQCACQHSTIHIELSCLKCVKADNDD